MIRVSPNTIHTAIHATLTIAPPITEAELARKALRILRLLVRLVHWTEVHLARIFVWSGSDNPMQEALPLIWRSLRRSHLSCCNETGSILTR